MIDIRNFVCSYWTISRMYGLKKSSICGIWGRFVMQVSIEICEPSAISTVFSFFSGFSGRCYECISRYPLQFFYVSFLLTFFFFNSYRFLKMYCCRSSFLIDRLHFKHHGYLHFQIFLFH